MLYTVGVLLQRAVETVSSHKFLALIYQLAARMSQIGSGFQTVLWQVRVSLCLVTVVTHKEQMLLYLVSRVYSDVL